MPVYKKKKLYTCTYTNRENDINLEHYEDGLVKCTYTNTIGSLCQNNDSIHGMPDEKQIELLQCIGFKL